MFDSVDYPITIEGDAWKLFQSIDFADMDGDGNSDVSMMFGDSNSSLLMLWYWDMESEQFVFQPELSYLGEDDDGRGDQVPDNDDGVPSLMCDSIPFTDTKNLIFDNYDDGTYYYEDMTEDGMVILINTVMPHDFLNDTRSIEEYMTDCALELCDSEPCLLAVEENDVYSAQMTFPVYIVTYTSGENEDTREWTVFAMNTDRYTYLYAFGSSCNAEDDVRSAYQDIFAELYLYY